MTFIFYLLFLTVVLLAEEYNYSIRNEKKLKHDDLDLDLNTAYKLLAIIGIFSSQWILFILFFFLSVLNKKNKILSTIDIVLSIILAFFIVINKYHLHINFYQLIKNLF